MSFHSPLGAPAPFAAYDTRQEWHILIRDDETGQMVSEVEDFTDATFIARFNDVGSWEFKTRYTAGVTDLVRRGHASVVARVGPDTVISGPVTRAARVWDEAGEQATLNGVSDLVWAASRIIRNWGIDTIDLGGSFGYVLAWLMYFGVAERTGPPLTVVAPEQGPEPYPCNVSVRWEPCLPALQAAARQSRPVYGFDIRDMTFETWLPTDPGVIFSAELGTMAGYELVVERPDANRVYVLGKREGPDRQWRLVENAENAAYWWPVEQVRDRSDVGEEPERWTDDDGNEHEGPWPDNQAELEVAGQEALAELDRPVAVKVTPIDVENQRFGFHYGLGDLATVVFPDGTVVQDIITEVTISLSTNGPLIVQPTVGQPQMSLDTFRDLRAVERRLNLLESR
jgi:hypothetical protein